MSGPHPNQNRQQEDKFPRRGFSRDLYIGNRLSIIIYVQSNIHTTFNKRLCQQIQDLFMELGLRTKRGTFRK